MTEKLLIECRKELDKRIYQFELDIQHEILKLETETGLEVHGIHILRTPNTSQFAKTHYSGIRTDIRLYLD